VRNTLLARLAALWLRRVKLPSANAVARTLLRIDGPSVAERRLFGHSDLPALTPPPRPRRAFAGPDASSKAPSTGGIQASSDAAGGSAPPATRRLEAMRNRLLAYSP
jgi:hypothetical protein